MASVIVRIDAGTREQLKEIADARGESMSAVLTKAVESYRRQCFLEGLNDDFAALKADARKWGQEQQERRVWDATLGDGLEDE